MMTKPACALLRSAAGGLLVLCVAITSLKAQQFLSGKVLKKNTNEVLIAVTVFNASQNKYDQTDLGGNYRVRALPGDTLIFSSSSYLPDTVVVDALIMVDRYNVFLQARYVELAKVKIGGMNSYQADSLQRIDDYYMFYHNRPPHLADPAGGYGGGFGIHFSPLSYFKKDAVQHRQLARRLKRDEVEFYINYKFPRELVGHLTGLHGDTLQHFMVLYRPSYAFCRRATQQDMVLYINDKFKEFKRH